MLIKNDFQRFALNTDNFTIIDNRQFGIIAMDYSNDYYAKNYIKWCMENCAKRLQRYCDDGIIYRHVDEKATECRAEQNKIWKKMIDTDEEYL